MGVFGRSWGGAWALLGLSGSLRGRNIAPGELNITLDARYRKTYKNKCFFIVFASYHRPKTALQLHLRHQESLGEASGSRIRVSDALPGFLWVPRAFLGSRGLPWTSLWGSLGLSWAVSGDENHLHLAVVNPPSGCKGALGEHLGASWGTLGLSWGSEPARATCYFLHSENDSTAID